MHLDYRDIYMSDADSWLPDDLQDADLASVRSDDGFPGGEFDNVHIGYHSDGDEF